MEETIEGKVPHGFLSELLSRLSKPGREVIVGPSVGEDAFAVGVEETALVASSDPITFTREHIGYYAVNVNANDVATMGARPRWFLATLLFPPGLKRSAVRRIFDQLDRACVELGVRLCGGHTEASTAVTRPVVIGTMIGTVPKQKLIRPGRARQGDRVLMTKRLALEGTSIIARERRRGVETLLGRRGAARARKFLFDPGISIVKEALCAAENARVHAMHDPTEGGVLWGLKELCYTTGIGAKVDLDKVPIYEETRLVCEHFGLNPLGLIASGSLLIVVSRRGAERVSHALTRIGIECTDIGCLSGRKLALVRGGKPVRIPGLKADEISRIV